jgi:elongation factor G
VENAASEATGRSQRRSEAAKLKMSGRETLTQIAEGEGWCVRRIEGRDHCALARVRLFPGEAGSGYFFESRVISNVIPKKFIKSIDAGIREALTGGILADYPVDDIRVELYDGPFHDVDSSELAFRIAGALAFQDAAKRARSVLLEPIMAVEIGHFGAVDPPHPDYL